MRGKELLSRRRWLKMMNRFVSLNNCLYFAFLLLLSSFIVLVFGPKVTVLLLLFTVLSDVNCVN